jgi:hypothetical protein
VLVLLPLRPERDYLREVEETLVDVLALILSILKVGLRVGLDGDIGGTRTPLLHYGVVDVDLLRASQVDEVQDALSDELPVERDGHTAHVESEDGVGSAGGVVHNRGGVVSVGLSLADHLQYLIDRGDDLLSGPLDVELSLIYGTIGVPVYPR